MTVMPAVPSIKTDGGKQPISCQAALQPSPQQNVNCDLSKRKKHGCQKKKHNHHNAEICPNSGLRAAAHLSKNHFNFNVRGHKIRVRPMHDIVVPKLL